MPNLVIIPTYKEKENIESLIKAIFSLGVPFDILIMMTTRLTVQHLS